MYVSELRGGSRSPAKIVAGRELGFSVSQYSFTFDDSHFFFQDSVALKSMLFSVTTDCHGGVSEGRAPE